MNLLFFLTMYFPLLDIAYEPSFTVKEFDSSTIITIIVVLVLFLAFMGYLIWNALRKDK